MALLILIFVAVFAPLISTHDPLSSMIGIEPGHLPGKPPCIPILGCEDSLHLMGLDLNGRDIFSRVIYGARISLGVGTASIVFATLAGGFTGLVSGYAGGWTDNILMRITDVILAFPQLLLAISFVTVFGPGLQNVLLAISLASFPFYARLARATVLATKNTEYIMAARAIGAGPFRIMFVQIMPHTFPTIIVQATLGLGIAILDIAALSFLGLGIQPPAAEWGRMLSEGRAYMSTSPHIVFYPGIAITITVLAINILGNGLRDALDPRLNSY
ncbi:MAG: ABC transporter permease [Chloroflexi bacterium]|nr:ABC transporter permease [Chloroflexota bacterium]